MIEMNITINANTIKFINQCFGNARFETQHDQMDIGKYSLWSVIIAFDKFNSDDWTFSHNCHDCSFPKFKRIGDHLTEACQECGD